MRLLICGLAMSFSMIANDAKSEITLSVDGQDYTLSALMERCQTLANDPAAQIACFGTVSKLVEAQAASEPESAISVSESLEAFRAAAQYQTEDTGLVISGAECRIQILYYNNYFHISRRNVSSIDLFSAAFDASQLHHDQISEIRGAQAPLVSGQLADGAVASTVGGIALESAQYNFAPKSARTSIGDYAAEVATQLATDQRGAVEFVLVHPARSKASGEIWGAFETYLKACNG